MLSQKLNLLALTSSLVGASPTWSSLNIDVPANVPSAASNVVDHGYPGFAMAVHTFQDYAGNLSSPNIFSRNLINNVAEKTGTTVHIRVGGTSGDTASYVPTQNTSIALPPGSIPGSIPRGITLGPAWFEGFASFPGVQWTYMAHFALNGSDARANAVAATKEALKYIGSDLEAIEVGNEIDIYPGVDRPSNFSVREYISQWMNYTEAIDGEVLAGTAYANCPIYQAPVYATHMAPWLVSNTFKQGIDRRHNIRSASLHQYMIGGNSSTTTLQGTFMNHSAIVANLSYFAQPVRWLQEHHPNIPLYLGETNSDTYSMNNTAYIGVFGSTLWLVDFMLYGMTLGIARMNIQQSSGFAYTSWVPAEYYGIPPAVLPPYYAQVYVADVIGSRSDIRISNIDLGMERMSAYAVYDDKDGQLAKIGLVNLEEWNTTTTYSRPVKRVAISVPDSEPAWPSQRFAKIEKLTAPGANSLTNITWAGTSYTYESDGLPVKVSQPAEYVPIWKGKLQVEIQATEALLISLCPVYWHKWGNSMC